MLTPTREQVAKIDELLGDFPGDEIESRLKEKGIQGVHSSQVPRKFTKFFALIDTVSGGLAGKSLIDFGCGMGVFVSQAVRLGMEAEGFDDFSEYGGRCHEAAECIAGAISKGASPRFTRLDLLGHDLHRQVDFVTNFGMLEHIHGAVSREKILKGMMMALKPGGHLLLVCGPNKRFPVDFFHYGPAYLFYHCLPVRIRSVYLRLFAGRRRNQDPKWLNGMSVNEIVESLRHSGGGTIERLFPWWVGLSNSRLFVAVPPARWLALFLSRLLSWMKAEPVIIVVARKSMA